MSLAEVLNKRFNGNYEKLFTPGGFLAKEGSQWTILKTRQIGRDSAKLEYFSALAKSIVEEGMEKIINPQNFIKRFNEEWSFCVLKEKNIQLHARPNEKLILFSSKINDHCYLSNFFPTLILLERPSDTPLVLFTAEHAYVYMKLNALGLNVEERIWKGTDPLKVKKEGHQIENAAGRELEDSKKIEIMNEISRVKYLYNPVLHQKLCSTGDACLVEHTQDAFWGDGSQATGEKGFNHLGKILMNVRLKSSNPTK